jgi:hypothetical protein
MMVLRVTDAFEACVMTHDYWDRWKKAVLKAETDEEAHEINKPEPGPTNIPEASPDQSPTAAFSARTRKVCLYVHGDRAGHV